MTRGLRDGSSPHSFSLFNHLIAITTLLALFFLLMLICVFTGWFLLLTTFSREGQYTGSTNPLAIDLRPNAPSSTTPFSRDWASLSLITPQPGDAFVLSFNGNSVVFEITNWCGWNSQTNCHSPHGSASDGHFHYAKGRVLASGSGVELASEAWMSSNGCDGYSFCDTYLDTIAFTTNPWRPSLYSECAPPSDGGTCDVSVSLPSFSVFSWEPFQHTICTCVLIR